MKTAKAMDPREQLRKALDKLVSKTTAFRSYESLDQCMSEGYVPTLSWKRANSRKLGLVLSRLGWRVFWIQKPTTGRAMITA